MSEKTAMPELLLPAGGFDAGIAAFEGGADAVYLGFKDFSARRQARNFTVDEYRRLLRFAHEGGKKVYAALNTVVLPSDDGELGRILSVISAYPPDAVIFQDWGLASLLHSLFPKLALHASTQTAIQTPEAALIAAAAGVSRVVLPRETTIAELASFVREVPGLEFEVFIHGALCYSFSGLCLASGILLGRSGNRGECAQVCRSYYARQRAAPPAGPASRAASGAGLGAASGAASGAAVGAAASEEGHWFSCRDLDLFEELPALVKTGASSLKVEGRMKSPEYCFALARLYRAGLDSLPGKPLDPKEEAELRERARIAFARNPTRAYSLKAEGEDLVDPSWPGHRGSTLGTVLRADADRVVIRLEAGLGLRDGVLALPPEPRSGRLLDPPAFSVQDLADAKSAKPLVVARPGSLVEFASPGALPYGTELRRISARDMDRRALSLESYPRLLRIIPALLSVGVKAGMGRLSLSLDLPTGSGRGEAGGMRAHQNVEDDEDLPLAASRSPGSFRKAAELFAESGDHDFVLTTSLAEDVRLELGELSLPLADLFLPPSLLKKAKNRLYSKVDLLLAAFDEEEARGLAAAVGASQTSSLPICPLGGTATIPPRGSLSFPLPGLSRGLPLALPSHLAEGRELPRAMGISYLALAPVVSSWRAYEGLVFERVKGELEGGARLMVGINALHHLPLARRLEAFCPDRARLGFFADIHLYVASSRAAEAWLSLFPNLVFAYEYVEKSAAANEIDLPLFVSKGCYMRHTAFRGACPDTCPKSYRRELQDRDRSYLVLIEDCVTMLFRKTAASS